MATTGNGIYYPSDYSAVADILSDLKKMAESIDESVENKVDKVDGKGLSTNDYTDAEKEKINLLMSEVITNKYNIEELQDDNAQNKSDISNIQAEQIEQNAKISELEAEKKELQEDVDALTITGQASGESIDLNDSSSARVKSFDIGGNSKQNTREGYNLLKNQLESQTINNISFVVNQDKSVKITGTANARTEPRLWTASSGDSLILKNGVTYYNTTSVKLYLYADTFYAIPANGNFVPTTDLTIQYIYIRIESGEQLNTTIYPQLTEKANAPYEPYGAMPSLNYKSEVQSAGDDINLYPFENVSFSPNSQNKGWYFIDGAYGAYGANVTDKTNYKFTIQAGTYTIDLKHSDTNITNYQLVTNGTTAEGIIDIISNKTFTLTKETTLALRYYINNPSLGIKVDSIKIVKGTEIVAYSKYGQGTINEVVCNKNLLNCKNLSNIAVNTGIEIDEDGYVSSGIQDTRKWDYENSNWFLTLPKGTYIISLIYETTPTNSATGLVVFKSDNTRLFDANYLPSFLSKIPIFTLEEKSKIGILLKMFDIKYKIQIEKATTATDYAEHEEQNISIPTQQAMMEGDYFIKEDGIWKEVHNFGKKEFDGTEEIGITSNGKSFTYTIDDMYKTSNFNDLLNFYSNRYIKSTWTERNVNNKENTIASFTSSIGFYKGDLSTTSEFKQKLLEWKNEGNPLVVFYPLQTQTKLTCTAEQNEALDKLENSRTYKNVTHIYSTDEVSPLMDVTYAKDLETVLANVQALANTQNETQNESEVEV